MANPLGYHRYLRVKISTAPTEGERLPHLRTIILIPGTGSPLLAIKVATTKKRKLEDIGLLTSEDSSTSQEFESCGFSSSEPEGLQS